MGKLFYKDELEGVEINYDQLIQELSTQTEYDTFCKSNSYYAVFKQIIFSLLIGEEIILLDSDFSDDEIIKLVGDQYHKRRIKNISPLGLFDISEILSRFSENKNAWKITLFTSGTTGLPKKISHNLETISRYVKIEDKRKDNIWGFAYNPTHIAGLQVFFQALLNQNSIIRLFGINRNSCLNLINEYKITNISATPTFYRLLLPADHICKSVNILTSGGEKFDYSTLSQLQHMFPNCKIRNVYASTEAGTLFASKGDLFSLKPEIENLVRVVENELFLHKSLMGESESLSIIDGWYSTGDLVEVISEAPLSFKFISRKSEMINTGGYKVNPTEVEETIRIHDGVKDVFVFGKQNRLLGNVVCCEVVKSDDNLSEKQLRDFLSTKLQEYKIPRIVKFVESLTTTRTGKLSRK